MRRFSMAFHFRQVPTVLSLLQIADDWVDVLKYYTVEGTFPLASSFVFGKRQIEATEGYSTVLGAYEELPVVEQKIKASLDGFTFSVAVRVYNEELNKVEDATFVFCVGISIWDFYRDHLLTECPLAVEVSVYCGRRVFDQRPKVADVGIEIARSENYSIFKSIFHKLCNSISPECAFIVFDGEGFWNLSNCVIAYCNSVKVMQDVVLTFVNNGIKWKDNHDVFELFSFRDDLEEDGIPNHRDELWKMIRDREAVANIIGLPNLFRLKDIGLCEIFDNGSVFFGDTNFPTNLKVLETVYSLLIEARKS